MIYRMLKTQSLRTQLLGVLSPEYWKHLCSHLYCLQLNTDCHRTEIFNSHLNAANTQTHTHTQSVHLQTCPFGFCRGFRNLVSNFIAFVAVVFVVFWRDSPQWAMASSFLRFLDHTQRRITVGRTPLDEWSARRRDLYLTTLTTDEHPCPRWDSNPQSQQASGRRPTP